MEHYDGPAFYRKFAVKPNPEQLEDTTNERAQRSVKQRQERNDRLRLREERVAKREQASKQAAPAKPRETPVAKSTPVSQATTPTPKSSDDENYRPFQMTPIPKQLHWSHPTSESRRRYQRLVAELHKDDSSFLLFGSAADITEREGASTSDTKPTPDQTAMSMASNTPTAETSAPETTAEPNTAETPTDTGDVEAAVAETSAEQAEMMMNPRTAIVKLLMMSQTIWSQIAKALTNQHLISHQFLIPNPIISLLLTPKQRQIPRPRLLTKYQMNLLVLIPRLILNQK